MRRIIDFFFIHAKCPICKKIGHKSNMTEKIFCNYIDLSHRAFYHHKCREKTFAEKLCECGKHWIPKKEK